MIEGAGVLVVMSLVIIGGTLAIGTAAVVGARLVHVRHDRRIQLLTSSIRPHLLALLSGMPADLPHWRGRDQRAFETLVLRHLKLVRGDAHGALVDTLERNGVLHRARRHVSSIGATRRCRGIELLGRAGCSTDRCLVEARLDDRDPDVRIVSARALGRIGDLKAAAALIASVDGPRPIPLAIVGQSLVQLGSGVASQLDQALVDGTPTIQALAAEVLGLLQSASSVAGLLDATAIGGEVEVRAIRSLGRIGSQRAVPRLTAILAHDPEWPNRAVAARALGTIGDPDSTPTLVRSLQDDRYEVALNAATALGEIGPRGHAALALASSGTNPGARFARQADARRRLRQADPVTPLPIPVT